LHLLISHSLTDEVLLTETGFISRLKQKHTKMKKFTNSVKYSFSDLMTHSYVFTTPKAEGYFYKIKRLNEFGDCVLMNYNKVEKYWQNVGECTMPKKALLRVSRYVCGLIMTFDIKLTTINVLPESESIKLK